MKFYISLFLSAFLAEGLCHNGNTLRKLQVVFRHGYRYPTTLFWTSDDDCATKYNATLLGNLTNRGKSQMNLLGLFIRIHYEQFQFKQDWVELWSSDYTRDNDSAILVYDGLFKNFGNTTKPIKLVDPAWDGRMNTNDSYYESWHDHLPLKQKYQGLMNTLKKLLKPEEKTDLTLKDLDLASDQMICELAESCTLPKWLNSSIQEQFQSYQRDAYGLYGDCANQQIIKENADEMLKHIKEVFLPNSTAPPVSLYALHDVNVAVLLTRLGVFNNLPVPFGAAIFFELHDIANRSVVKIFYDNSTDYSSMRELKLPGCEWNCTYEDLVKAFDYCSLGSQLQSSVFIVSSLLLVFYVQ